MPLPGRLARGAGASFADIVYHESSHPEPIPGRKPRWWERLLGVRHAPYDPARDEVAEELARVAAGLGDVADEIGLIRRAITGNLPLDLVRGDATRDEWTEEDSP